MKKYDLIVIGGGPGGYVAAIYGAQQGLKTALIEKAELGGTCLNWGCIPTKALAHNAEVLRIVKNAKAYGIALEEKEIKGDYKVAQKRSREVANKLNQGIQGLMKKNKITVYKEKGLMFTNNQVTLEKNGEILEGRNIILATGSHANQLPGIDYNNPKIMTAREALELTEIEPGEKIGIIGAGAIGMEFGSIWESYGAKVTVIEMFSNALPNEDIEVSKEIEKAFKKRGIEIKTDTKVTAVEDEGKTLKVTLEAKGTSEDFHCTKLLVSAGIKPNTEGMGLEKIGVALTPQKTIQVNESFQTTCPNIYAIGDVTGKLSLAHVASAQAIEAVKGILGKKTKELNYTNIPKCTYTYPEVASVGLTEAQAKEKGYDVRTEKFPFSANGKSLAMNESTGFVKIVADQKYNEILGIHFVGAHVTELISAPTAYIDLEFTVDEVAQVVHPHPSVSEVIMEAAHSVLGGAIHF
ncbi:MAG: dihydrolipoyl dehydrogenase [Eubacteriaceae bacterium]